MQTMKQVISSFMTKGDLRIQEFCKKTLDRLFSENSSIENDMRALLRKSALIKKSLAEHKSLTNDRSSFYKVRLVLIEELRLLTVFMEHVLTSLPLEAFSLSDCIRRNKSYIRLNSA